MDDFLSTLYRGEVRPNEGCGRCHGEMLSLERLGERLIGDLKSEISEKAFADLEIHQLSKRAGLLHRRGCFCPWSKLYCKVSRVCA